MQETLPTQKHRGLSKHPVAVWQHQLLRQLVPEGRQGVLVPAGPPFTLPQVPLQQALVGLQLCSQLGNAGLGLLQAKAVGLCSCRG